jgi:hypothetical protein
MLAATTCAPLPVPAAYYNPENQIAAHRRNNDEDNADHKKTLAIAPLFDPNFWKNL